MKLIKKLVLALSVVLVVFVVVGFFLPSTWRVERSIGINAAPEVIYEEVANLHNWLKWSPWTGEQDKTLVYTYSGASIGATAKQSWTSKDMGQGWLEIQEASPEKGITYTLYIDMGFMTSTLTGEMEFSREDGQTKVVWVDRGDSGFNIIKRYFSLMMDSALGKEMDSGLMRLKALAEAVKPADQEPAVAPQ